MSTSVDGKPRIRRYLLSAVGLALVVVSAALVPLFPAGCSVDPKENIAKTQITEDLAQPVDDLTLASSAMLTIPTAPDSAARAHYYFNKWIQQQDSVEIDEKLDPLIDNLPQSYRTKELPLELKRRVIGQGDVFYLLECSWFRDVAARVAKTPVSAELAPWLAEQEKSLGIGDTEKLSLAARLFDWTVLNIQLDPLPPPPAPPKATAETNDPASTRDSLPGPIRGEVGPGYGHLPWQTLVYGHGDAWERSRVFILLARQAGMDVVMLAVPEKEGTGGHRPWLPALLLRNQLYLFDLALGFPIPGPDRKGIATLEQVVADPSLLRVLDLPGAAAYPIGAEDLRSVSALVDAELASLTIRMRLVESAFSAKRKLTLTCRPSELEKKLRQCKHISSVSIWRVAVDAEYFQAALPIVLRSDPVKMAEYNRLMLLFQPGRPLMFARHLHLLGTYEAPPDEETQLGARERYSRLRAAEKLIDSLEDSKGREIAGLADLPLASKPEERKKQLEDMQMMMRTGKHHATYWIAQTHYDTGDYHVAREWFEDRLLKGAPESPWLSGARYNLARCYEALGQWENARNIYLADDSPQRHGNLLRAAMISARHLGATPAADQTPPPAPGTKSPGE